MTASLFWPETDTHTLVTVDLAPLLTPRQQEAVELCRQMAAAADGVRALQAADGTFPPSTPRPPESWGVQREEGWTHIGGPLCTWRAKTRSPLWSYVAAVDHAPGQRLVDGLDASLEDALAWARDKAGAPEVEIAQVWPMYVTDLVVAGGEANAFPKHFAYFLPEDLGQKGSGANYTVLFRNAYGLRHDKTVGPLAERCLVGGWAERSQEEVRHGLVCWMRGHDIAHGIRTSYSGSVGPGMVGYEPWFSLQEVIADTFGTLLACSPYWSVQCDYTSDQMAELYMTEMLGYLRRGPWHWSDAGAACIEANFLLDHGFVELVGPKLYWEPDNVVRGLATLANALQTSVLRGSPESVRGFLKRYAWREYGCPAEPLVATLRKAKDIPTSLVYTR